MFDDPELNLAVQGFEGRYKLEDILFMVKRAARIGPIQVVRAAPVVGFDHVRHAYILATRSMLEGKNQAKSLEVELVRYLAADRQITKALAKMGVTDGGGEALVISWGEKRIDTIEYFLDGLGLKKRQDIPIANEISLLEFDITLGASEAVTKSRYLDLVLERVAELDIVK